MYLTGTSQRLSYVQHWFSLYFLYFECPALMDTLGLILSVLYLYALGSPYHFGGHLGHICISLSEGQTAGICFACTQKSWKRLGDCPLPSPFLATDGYKGIKAPAPLPLTRTPLGVQLSLEFICGVSQSYPRCDLCDKVPCWASFPF